MRKFNLKFLIFSFFLILNISFAQADSIPITEAQLKELVNETPVQYSAEKKEPQLLYVQNENEEKTEKIITDKEIKPVLKPEIKQEIKPAIENKTTVKLQEKIQQPKEIPAVDKTIKQVISDDILKPSATTLIEKSEKKINALREEKKIKKFQENENFFDFLKLDEPKEKIISQAERKINAIYPSDKVSPTNTYPGYRGPNQLVIYTKQFGKTTGTNEFGKEAVIIDDTVVRLTGANSTIPRDGFVVSGHGNAKKWINDNLKIGTKIEIKDRTIKAYTTVDSYRFFAKSKINEVEDILISTKTDYTTRDDKFIYYYLKKAKQQYKKSQKSKNVEDAINCAQESIKNATLAYRYTLPYLENELKGVWIRPNQKTIEEVQKTLDLIKDTGINNVFLETYFHGYTIYPSHVMEEYGFTTQNPSFTNFDMLKVWTKEAHKRGIKVHTWFESFYIGNKHPSLNPKSILAVKPEWQNKTKQKAEFEGYVSHPQEHNGYFLDPANPEVTNFLLSLINEITTKYDVDGVNIDYIRYPNISKENYNNQWGYTQYARDEFKALYDFDPLDLQAKSANWEHWCNYRRDKISSYVYQVSQTVKNKNIVLSAVIFPDYKVSLATKFQDWALWAKEGYINAVTPLILTSDDSLAKDMLEEIKKKTMPQAYVYPGLFAGFIESDPEDLLKQIHIIRKLGLSGIILFDWAHLNEKYLEAIKTSAFKAQSY